ncbi:oligosaccharide flippase family protein [Maribacter sp. R86514]|uniref:oligosaccharide flippase family protein n=1 Tax=Maribacter sp. R86514 TaxID=3093854 RepID=UPI0037CCA291
MIALKLICEKVCFKKILIGGILFVNLGNYFYSIVSGSLFKSEVRSDVALLIRFLLVLSLLILTFLPNTAKLVDIFVNDERAILKYVPYKFALVFGMLIGLLLFTFTDNLLYEFYTASDLLYIIFVFSVVFSLKYNLQKVSLNKENERKVVSFVILIAYLEFIQIVIHNCNILLVKHYFDTVDVGIYSSLAMIGSIVYFVILMFVLFLIPAVIQRQKNGKVTAPVLMKYIGYIGLLVICIIIGCTVLSKFIINLMLGEAFLGMAPLLWQYALASSLFAISNLFAYHFLSLNQYLPVILSGVIAIAQIIIIAFFHSSLVIVVQMQIIAMVFLLTAQILFFKHNSILHKYM